MAVLAAVNLERRWDDQDLSRTAVGAGIWVLLDETVLWLVPGDVRPAATANTHDDDPVLARKGWGVVSLERVLP